MSLRERVFATTGEECQGETGGEGKGSRSRVELAEEEGEEKGRRTGRGRNR